MKELCYLGSVQPPPETRGELSTALITLQSRQGLEQELMLLECSLQQEGGIWPQLCLPWVGDTWALCCQRVSGTWSCGRWGSCHLEVVLEVAVMGLPVAQHHPTPAKECCCSAAEQQEQRQGQHFMEELQAQQRELCRLQRCEMLHLLCWRGGIEVRWEI